MPGIHQASAVFRPDTGAAALCTVRLRAGSVLAGSMLGYRLKATAVSIATRNADDARNAAESRLRRRRKIAVPSAPAAASGKTWPQGWAAKRAGMWGWTRWVQTVAASRRATVAQPAVFAARRARSWITPSVFTAIQRAPWWARAATAVRPASTV